jgi:hypothetical protein
MIAADPGQGGASWAVLQYVLGLQLLGHEVYLVEPISPNSLRPKGASLQDSENARYFIEVAEAFGLQHHAALLLSETRDTCGLAYSEIVKATHRADVHLNIAGMLTDERLIAAVPIRIYLDLDPAFTQLWHAVQGIDMRFSDHTHHVTIGLNIGSPGCPVPTCDREWLPTVQPIALSHWPVSTTITCNALTTVGNWRGYGSVEHQGVFYGQKVHSLREFYPLPTKTNETFCLAMAIHPAEEKDLAELAHYGWHLLDPRSVAATPQDYQRFIQTSKGELGVAKSGYVNSRCGWFSDRSLAYLASGKPVIAQETGFRDHLPTGAGLLSFSTIPDALEAIECLREDYNRHTIKARELAEELFDSQKVLPRLLEAVGC